MKCKNCNCQVSSDFQHAFTTNCCPKCGETIMNVNVQDLYLKMNEVLRKNNNDIGDLAVWFVNTYIVTPAQAFEEMELVSHKEAESPEHQEQVEQHDLPQLPKKPAHKVHRTSNSNKEQMLLPSERTNLFAKRAGVDKIKYETLVKDIQGAPTSIDDTSIDDESFEDSDMEEEPFNDTPLSNREMQSVVGLFEEPEKAVDFTEIQKIQKLEQLATTGSIGKIRRSS